MKALNIRGDLDDAFRTFAVRTYGLGTRMHLPDGRVFRYSRAGSAALAVARAVQAARQNREVSDAPIKLPRTGPRTLTISTLGTKRIAADVYEDGLLYVNDGTGEGHVYHVAGNTLREPSVGAAAELTVHLDSDFVTNPDSSSRVTLLRNRYNGIVIAAAPPNSAVVGVTPVAVGADAYFWLQTSGPCAVLQQDDLEVYLPVQASRVTSGAVAVATVVVPRTAAGERQGAEGRMVEQVFSDDAGPLKGRLAPTSGVGVVPVVEIGYVLDPREHGQHCLVHLTLEG